MMSLERAGLQAISALCRAVDARDSYTAGHNERVSRLARCIAQELGLPHERIEAVRLGATLHDIGKLRVPADILMQSRPLHGAERALVQLHPVWGAEILEGVEFPWPIATIVRQHHERLDGSGYPDGLSGDQILLEAQIIAVADVIDALSSHRPYRAAQSVGLAQTELGGLRGSHLDHGAIDACIELLHKKDFGYPA